MPVARFQDVRSRMRWGILADFAGTRQLVGGGRNSYAFGYSLNEGMNKGSAGASPSHVHVSSAEVPAGGRYLRAQKKPPKTTAPRGAAEVGGSGSDWTVRRASLRAVPWHDWRLAATRRHPCQLCRQAVRRYARCEACDPDAGPAKSVVMVDFASSRWCAVKRGREDMPRVNKGQG